MHLRNLASACIQFLIPTHGIGTPSIWDDLQAQNLLGVEGFADGRINDSWTAELEEAIFTAKPRKAARDRLIAEAIATHGYSQMEVANFLGLHYSTISRILAAN